jgi:hypothetical protein
MVSQQFQEPFVAIVVSLAFLLFWDPLSNKLLLQPSLSNDPSLTNDSLSNDSLSNDSLSNDSLSLMTLSL